MSAMGTAAASGNLLVHRHACFPCLIFCSSDATVDEIEDYLEALRSMYERLQVRWHGLCFAWRWCICDCPT